MALASPITISEEGNMIQSWMQQWVSQYAGSAALVSNLRDLWNSPNLNSQSPRVLICYVGEVSRGDFAHWSAWHRVDRQWNVAVTKGRGYYANRGDSLANSNATALPFYDAVEQARDWLRRMLGISEETPNIDYKGAKISQPNQMVVDAAILEFSTANDIPFIGTLPNNPP